MITWTPAVVAIDDFLGPYPAEIADTRWNGFACPRFTREVAERIVADSAKITGPDDDVLRWDGATVVIHSPVYADDDDYQDERIDPDAQGRYAIGAWSWTWQTA